MKKKVTLQSKVATSSKPLAKVIPMTFSPAKNIILAEDTVMPTLSDIMKMQAMKIGDAPDKNEPIVLSDTWYEYSVFKNKFNISQNTANSWLRKWLPSSKIEKMRFINKVDIENMLLRFRRYGLVWFGWVLSFSGEWESLCML